MWNQLIICCQTYWDFNVVISVNIIFISFFIFFRTLCLARSLRHDVPSAIKLTGIPRDHLFVLRTCMYFEPSVIFADWFQFQATNYYYRLVRQGIFLRLSSRSGILRIILAFHPSPSDVGFRSRAVYCNYFWRLVIKIITVYQDYDSRYKGNYQAKVKKE